MTQRRRRIRLTAFVVTVLLGAAVLLTTQMRDEIRIVRPAALGFWLTFCLAAETFWLPAVTGRGMVSMGLAAEISAVFLLPAGHALAVVALAVLLSDLLLHHRGMARAAFNAAQTTLALGLGAMALRGTGSYGTDLFLLHPMATLAVLPVFFMVNTFLVSGAISLEKGEPFWRTWKDTFGHPYHMFNTALLYVVGLGLVATLERVGYVSALFSLLILMAAREAYRLHTRPLQKGTMG
jgi:hypothetical protein